MKGTVTKVGIGRGGGQRVDGAYQVIIIIIFWKFKWILVYTEPGYNNHSNYNEPR